MLRLYILFSEMSNLMGGVEYIQKYLFKVLVQELLTTSPCLHLVLFG
jgi:hypothetical protein